jgi:hypothetical protein
MLLSTATTSHIGMVVCSNAHIHATVSDVTCGGTASGMIAYISSTGHGLAIALEDFMDANGTAGSERINWTDANAGGSKYARARPTSYSGVSAWRLTSKSDYENMMGASGCQDILYLYNLQGRQSISCGGTDMRYSTYWTSTLYNGNYYYYLDVFSGRFGNGSKTYEAFARACFTF